MDIILVTAALVLAVGFGWLLHVLDKRAIGRKQAVIALAFEQHRIRRPELKDAVAVRIVDQVMGGNQPYVQTHRIYRTREGSYVLFICTSGEVGYLEPLSRARAADALRSSPEIFNAEFPNGVELETRVG